MKSIVISFVAVLTSVLASCGQIESQSNLDTSTKFSAVKVARLDFMKLDINIPANENFGGSLTVDTASSDVSISIQTCPPNARCVWGGPRYSASIVKTTTDKCGVTTIVAEKDLRRVDGAYTQIIVKDNSENTCSSKKHDYMVEATLVTKIVSRQNGKEGETYSELKSKKGFSFAK